MRHEEELGYTPPRRPLLHLWPANLVLVASLLVGAFLLPRGAFFALWAYALIGLPVLLLAVIVPLWLRARPALGPILALVACVGLLRGYDKQILTPPSFESCAGHAFLVQIESQPKQTAWSTSFEAQLLAVDSQVVDRPMRVNLQYLLNDSAWAQLGVGSQLALRGQYDHPVAEGNPNAFSFTRWNAIKGRFATIRAFPQTTHVTSGPSGESGFDLKRWAQRSLAGIRDTMLGRLDAVGIEGQANALVAAMTLADKSDLDPELKQEFARAGIAHVLVLSGLHAGFVFLIFTLLCQLIPLSSGWGRFLRNFLPIISIWFFVALCGFGTSLLRAALMITFVAVGRQMRVRVHPLDSLLCAATFILFLNPNTVLDLGFQLSFGALWGIFCFNPALSRFIRPRTQAVSWLYSMLSASLSAQLGTLPIVLYHFGTLPVLSILSNLFAIPIAGVLVPLGLFIEVLPPSLFVAQGLAWVERFLAHTLIELTGLVNRIPVLQLEGMRISGLLFVLLMLTSLFLGLHLALRRRRLLLPSLLLVLLSVPLTVAYWVRGYHGSELAVLAGGRTPTLVLRQGPTVFYGGDSSKTSLRAFESYCSSVPLARVLPIDSFVCSSHCLELADGWATNLGAQRIVALSPRGDSVPVNPAAFPPTDLLIVEGEPGRDFARKAACLEPRAVVMRTKLPRWKERKVAEQLQDLGYTVLLPNQTGGFRLYFTTFAVDRP